jgi:hypothetical protein
MFTEKLTERVYETIHMLKLISPVLLWIDTQLLCFFFVLKQPMLILLVIVRINYAGSRNRTPNLLSTPLFNFPTPTTKQTLYIPLLLYVYPNCLLVIYVGMCFYVSRMENSMQASLLLS